MPDGLMVSCCVCGASDARALVEVTLISGERVTLCGSHAIMHSRSRARVRSRPELRELLRDRRERQERRIPGDELGVTLSQAFARERRERDRRRA